MPAVEERREECVSVSVSCVDGLVCGGGVCVVWGEVFSITGCCMNVCVLPFLQYSLYSLDLPLFSLSLSLPLFASLAATVNVAQREEIASLHRTLSPVNAPANSHS